MLPPLRPSLPCPVGCAVGRAQPERSGLPSGHAPHVFQMKV
jgi:hypothetical protein